MPDSDPVRLAERASAAMHADDLAAQALGISIEEVRPGYARLRMRIRDDMVNGHDVCHGGYLFALADTAFAHACNSYNVRTVATTCTIDFLRSGRRGQLIVATAEERWRSSRTGVYDVTVRSEDDELLALFRGKSFAIGRHLVDPQEAD